IRKLSLDIRQNSCSREHSMRNDGRETKQLRRDGVGMDRIVVPANRGVVADLSRRDPQYSVRRPQLRLFLRRWLRLVGQTGPLLVQECRHLMPRLVVADADI